MNRSLTATLKYALTSDKKLQLVAKLVRGKKVNDALATLTFTPKKTAKILMKVIKSAAANATNNANMSSDALYISRIEIGKGPMLKRMKFVGRSRVHGIVKYRSFVKVVLSHENG